MYKDKNAELESRLRKMECFAAEMREAVGDRVINLPIGTWSLEDTRLLYSDWAITGGKYQGQDRRLLALVMGAALAAGFMAIGAIMGSSSKRLADNINQYKQLRKLTVNQLLEQVPDEDAKQKIISLLNELNEKAERHDAKLDALADWLADWRENGSKIDADNPPQGTAAVVRDAILKCWTDYQAAPDNFAPDTIQRGKGQKPSLEECLKFRENDIIHNGQTLGQLLEAARKKDSEHTRLATFKRLVTSAQRQARRPGK